MATARFMPVESSLGSFSSTSSTSSIFANFSHISVDVFVRQARLIFQRKRDVFGDRQRIEQGARLKHHRDLAPDLFKLALREIGHVRRHR